MRRALDNISLELETGTFAIVIGSNGAGKSTSLNAIAGEIILDSGSIHVGDHDVTKLPTHRRTRWISRVFQDPMLGTAPDMTVEENLSLAERRGEKRGFGKGLNQARRSMYRDRLADIGLGLENRLTDKVELLSGGQRQSLSLVMSIVKKPDILLLDEHTAALDPRTAQLVMEATVRAVESEKLTTLMVTHNMQHAIDYGNRILMMESGRIKISFDAEEKKSMTTEKLVERFHVTDDKILLTG